MYRPRFLGLDETAHLIAHQLRQAHPTDYPALEEGRRELVRALFDGTVRSQGVLYELPPPPPPDQYGPFPIPSSDEPAPIASTWWSNHRYEKVTRIKPDSTDFGIEWQLHTSPLEVASEAAVVEKEDLSSGGDTTHSNSPIKYQLDKGVINWSNDSFEIDENYVSDWTYSGIQLFRVEIEALFHISGEERPTNTLNDSQQRLQPPQGTGVKAPDREVGSSASALEGRRRGRPPDSREAIHKWLDDELVKNGPLGVNKNDTVLAHIYCTEILRIRDEDLLRKGVDAQRKHVATWKRGGS